MFTIRIHLFDIDGCRRKYNFNFNTLRNFFLNWILRSLLFRVTFFFDLFLFSFVSMKMLSMDNADGEFFYSFWFFVIFSGCCDFSCDFSVCRSDSMSAYVVGGNQQTELFDRNKNHRTFISAICCSFLRFSFVRKFFSCYQIRHFECRD